MNFLVVLLAAVACQAAPQMLLYNGHSLSYPVVKIPTPSNGFNVLGNVPISYGAPGSYITPAVAPMHHHIPYPVRYTVPTLVQVPTHVQYAVPAPVHVPTSARYSVPATFKVANHVQYTASAPVQVPTPIRLAAPAPVQVATPVQYAVPAPAPVQVATPVQYAAPTPPIIAAAPVSIAAAPEPLQAPEPPMPSVGTPFVGGQFHAQDEAGQYSFGHWGGPNTRVETRDSLGRTSGSFAYVDPSGDVQVRKYSSSPASGFRVAASDLP